MVGGAAVVGGANGTVVNGIEVVEVVDVVVVGPGVGGAVGWHAVDATTQPARTATANRCRARGWSEVRDDMPRTTPSPDGHHADQWGQFGQIRFSQ